jgi:3-phenylpropionate/cinnamic acid dioxygenase small subunit
MTNAIIDPREIEMFLYREAMLLDTGQFEAWFDLFTEDALYWVPAGHDDIDPTRHVSIIHDDHAALRKRIARLRSGHAYAQDPASRMHRIVSNVLPGAFDGGELDVSAMMILFELSRHKQTIHSCRCSFRLRRHGENWLIRSKKVGLLRNNEVLDCTGYLL